MLDWMKLSFKDSAAVESHIDHIPPETSDLNFTNIWMWDHIRDTHYAMVQGFLCVRILDHGIEKVLMPVGSGDWAFLLRELQDDFKRRDKRLFLRAVTEEQVREIKKVFPGAYDCMEEEGRADYVYSHDDLAELKGNRYQGKRNLVFQFNRNYGHVYKDIESANIPLIAKMQNQWLEDNPDKRNQHLYDEHISILRVLQNFNDLRVKGGALLVDERVVAYTIAEQISPQMLLIHVEKALHPYKGAYQAINQEFMRHFSRDILEINREEDLGLPNLSKAKKSYHPKRMIKKFAIAAPSSV